jgi:general secretion pathway protein G
MTVVARCPTLGCVRVVVEARPRSVGDRALPWIPGVGWVAAVGVMVLLLFGVVAGPSCGGGGGKIGAVKGQIAIFEQCLASFEADCGRYPTTAEGLGALRHRPPYIKGWKGPYLTKEVPNDPWGNPYNYRSPTQHAVESSTCFDVWSNGPDGEEGTADDIQNWALDKDRK